MVEVKLAPLPPKEAMAYFRSKGLAPADARFDYRDTWREQHAGSFVVAKAMQDDILDLIRTEIATAQAEGRSFAQFAAEVEPVLRAKGWWGRQTMTDPLTGETKVVRLGSMHRLQTIFDTNMRTAAAAGRWAKIQRTKRAFPYLRYRQIDRPTRRLQHQRFDGLVRPVDDPIWARIYPPNGWFCGCTVEQITQGQVDRGEVVVSPPFDLDEVEWENERTGRHEEIPRGVHPGFDVNPGMIWLDMESRMQGLAGHPHHAALVGIATQLRLNVLREGFERGAYLTPDGNLLGPVQATRANPYRLSAIDPRLAVPPGSDFIHTHPGGSPLSTPDILSASHRQLANVIAVTPEGSIFSAHPREGSAETLKRHLVEFGRQIAQPWVEPRLAQATSKERQWLIEHARLLWLERHGQIEYLWNVAPAQRDLLKTHAGFFEDLLRDVS